MGTRTTLLRPKTGQACSASRLPLGGFLTQNKTRQKLCFPGPQKSCSHLGLLRGCAINHPLPDSLYALQDAGQGRRCSLLDGRSIATKLQWKEGFLFSLQLIAKRWNYNTTTNYSPRFIKNSLTGYGAPPQCHNPSWLLHGCRRAERKANNQSYTRPTQ